MISESDVYALPNFESISIGIAVVHIFIVRPNSLQSFKYIYLNTQGQQAITRYITSPPLSNVNMIKVKRR